MTELDEPVASQLSEVANKADISVRQVDLAAVVAEGSRRTRNRRKRRQIAATLVVVASVALVVTVPHVWLRQRAQPTPTTSATHHPTKHTGGVSVAQLISGRWSTMPAAPIAPRGGAVVVWTGRELIIWGGSSGAHGSQLHADGAAYDPSTNTWRKLPPSPLGALSDASGVWTGKEMVVFGGYDDESLGAFRVTNDAAAYDPSTNTWRMLPAAPLSPRADAIAFWTGTSVMVLGGRPAVTTSALQSYGDGAAFDPSTEMWQHIAAPIPPHGHPLAWQTAAEAGDQVLAFSVWSKTRSLGSGRFSESGGVDLFAFDPTTNSWQLIPPRSNAVPAPEEALWTGHVLFVRGGYVCPGCLLRIEPEVTDLYDPSLNSWTLISPDPLASSGDLSSVWTGEALFSFNPETEVGTTRPGASSLYDPSTGRWSLLPTAPLGCNAGWPLEWTGRQILIYCPQFGSKGTSPAGLIYTPAKSARVRLPNLLRMTKAAAKRVLSELGLRCHIVVQHHAPAIPPPAGSVIAEQPAAGSVVALGTAVTIVIQG
jgi:N-acetylneuraminic acid mutarotase